MTKIKRTEGQTMIHIKLNIEQQKPGVRTDSPDR